MFNCCATLVFLCISHWKSRPFYFLWSKSKSKRQWGVPTFLKLEHLTTEQFALFTFIGLYMQIRQINIMAVLIIVMDFNWNCVGFIAKNGHFNNCLHIGIVFWTRARFSILNTLPLICRVNIELQKKLPIFPPRQIMFNSDT